MAVNWKAAGISRGSTTYKCLPETMEVNPEMNGRHDLPDIQWLVDSILNEGGQQTPVKARNNGGRPCLVSGFSRWRAIMQINREKLTPEPLEIIYTLHDGNEQTGYLVNLAENIRRNDLTALDQAEVCTKLAGWGMTPEQIALRFPKPNGVPGAHQTASWVKARLKLSGATPEVQQAVRDGKLGVTAAAHISKLADEAQKVAVETGEVPEPTRRKMNLSDVKVLLERAVNESLYPEGVTADTRTEDFCGVLLDLLRSKVGIEKGMPKVYIPDPAMVAGEALAF
jgi:ParB-like chromosome segregation protein Spo0J